ncbi:MAG: flagellar motor protein [Solirubrobacteraceae bacterium]|nr:flagellar motor protein [Solirubrobacteraceae bacterium]
MKAASAIGVLGGIACIAVAATLEGTPLTALFVLPAWIIVLGGTFCATLGSTGFEGVKSIPTGYKVAFSPPPLDRLAHLRSLVSFSERARKEGLLALESDLEQIDDDFTRNGLQLVVDGTDPELVREVLEGEIAGMQARHKAVYEVFEKAGGLSPTIGIIGTVVSLIHVLGNLADPASLGPSISSAFIATLMGVGSANLVYFPIANRLKRLSSEEADMRAMVLDGVLAIQAGDNPRIVTQKLLTFLPPEERGAAQEPSPTLRPVADEPQQAAAAA